MLHSGHETFFRAHTFAPAPALRPYVDDYHILEARDLSGASNPWRMMPNGSAHLLLHVFRGAGPHWSRMVFVGPRSVYKDIDRRRRAFTLAVRFRPGGAAPFFSAPLRALRNDSTPLETTWTGDTRSLVEQLTAQAERGALHRCVRMVERALHDRLAHDNTAPPLIAACRDRLDATGGSERISDLADHLGVSERHLRAVMGRFVGLSPKQYARMVRFTRAVRSAHAGWPHGWAALAAQAGYYDQSHLIEEFHALVGESPTQFLERENWEW